MTTFTIELPEHLSQQIHTRGISQQGLERMFTSMVQIFLRKSDTIKPTVYQYPTVPISASSIDGFIGIVPGVEGVPKTPS